MGALSGWCLIALRVVAVLSLIATIDGPQPGLAATITVGPACSLINAIRSANVDTDKGGCTHTGAYGADTIVLPFNAYDLNAPDNGDNGLPVVVSAIVIMGHGSTIARSFSSNPPFFRLLDVGANGDLTLRDLTLSGGRVVAPGGSAEGGAIRVRNGGRLTLNTVTVRDSVVDASGTAQAGAAGTARGGGIFVGHPGQLTVIDAVIRNNAAVANGVGAQHAGGDARGGGIYVQSDDGDVSVSGTAIRANDVTANGGTGTRGGNGGTAEGAGMYVQTGSRSLTLSKVTVRNNTASAIGGDSSAPDDADAGHGGGVAGAGVRFESFTGNVTVTNAVINFNSATVNGGAGGGVHSGSGGRVSGGGLAFESAGTLVMLATSVSNNASVAQGGDGTVPGRGDGGSVDGGGVLFEGRNLVLDRGSITNNSASVASGDSTGAHGGQVKGVGLKVAQNGDPFGATLTSITVANNAGNAAGSAPGTAQGAGIYVGNEGGLTIVNATITRNKLKPGAAADGGGIYQDGTKVLTRVQNSIVSDNIAAGSPDCAAASGVVSLGSNIIGTLAGCALAQGPNDRVGVPPGLGAFVDTGDPASGVFSPAPGSAALDAADPGACPAKDQLGQGRAGVCDVGAVEVVPTATLLTSILPISRAGQLGEGTLTAFVSIINASGVPAFNVGIRRATAVPAAFHFQTTDPATNSLINTPDTGVDIPAGATRTFAIALRPTAAFAPTPIAFDFEGPNTAPVAPQAGLNTLLASAAIDPIADIVALSGTATNDGIVHVSGPGGSGAFVVATTNLGAPAEITVTASTAATTPAPTVLVCQTNPATAVCLAPPAPAVELTIGTSETPTFAVFVTANGGIPLDPAVNRISVNFSQNGQPRGATGVAVTTDS